MHKEKKLKATVRHMLSLDIYHPERIISINRQINHLARKESENISDKRKYNKLIKITDEIAVIAESAIHASSFTIVRISQQFSNKQRELKELYDTF